MALTRKKKKEGKANPGDSLRNIKLFHDKVFALYHTAKLALDHDLIGGAIKDDFIRDLNAVKEFYEQE